MSKKMTRVNEIEIDLAPQSRVKAKKNLSGKGYDLIFTKNWGTPQSVYLTNQEIDHLHRLLSFVRATNK